MKKHKEKLLISLRIQHFQMRTRRTLQYLELDPGYSYFPSVMWFRWSAVSGQQRPVDMWDTAITFPHCWSWSRPDDEQPAAACRRNFQNLVNCLYTLLSVSWLWYTADGGHLTRPAVKRWFL